MKTALESIGPAVFAHTLDIPTRQPLEFINLTPLVEQVVAESGIAEGAVLIQSRHSTAAILVNEWQQALLDDLRLLLEESVPARADWRHNDARYSDCVRGNAASHLRAMLVGAAAMLPVAQGRVSRGTWQSIILAEFDGPRTCSVSVRVLGL